MSKQLESVTTHGMSYTSEYASWIGMKKRCYSKSHSAYEKYGGRGITVCEEWLEGFENFYDDMGDKPGKGYSIDRIDTNGNYEPENCRWATSRQQANNRRYNHIIEYNGERKSLAQWARIRGISSRVLSWRLNKGWSIKDVLFKPIRK